MAASRHRLEQALGHTFTRTQLFEQALTHRSSTGSNNERLEFLGDSLVNFLVAEWLYQQFPAASEGELSRMRAQLVKGKTLAAIGRAFGLGDYLNLGPGEMKSGGSRRDSILADAVEALAAAVYLDAGIDTLRPLLLAWYGERLQQVKPGEASKDAKTRLQEWLQGRRRCLPRYTLVTTRGSEHAQQFEIACEVEGVNKIFSGRGSSRRAAEQAAADEALAFLENL